ncbi:inhibitor of apoptosis domain-containing protein [Ditylenchus destructor]|uniref:Inhibitor of apoptosis domain-containing protein n=1 Tax=Ditylenchus destructor TaxID=166010 RepID=A0AAD4N6P0_9BILA|nr:inhibitor of apoptosis domain-containing protein [Ditylenchus destructor]
MKTTKPAFESMDLKYFKYENRIASFGTKWRYDKLKNGATCTSKNLAKAGFFCTSTPEEPDSAKCYICLHELCWDPTDDPFTEHEKHQPYCEFVKLNKPEDDYTVRDWLRLLAYANSTHQYAAITEATDGLKVYMQKLGNNTEKVLQK